MNPAINEMVTAVSQYMPSLLGAGAFLIVGWMLALVISMIIGSIIAKTPLNRMLTDLLGNQATFLVPAEKKIATLLYYLLMLIVLVGVFQTLGLSIVTQPLNTLLNKVFSYMPSLLGGGLLIALAWILATVVRSLIVKLLSLTTLDEKMTQHMPGDDTAPIGLSKSIGDVSYWFIFLLFIPSILAAFELHGMLVPVMGMMNEVLSYLPNILSAALIFAIGWFVSNVVKRLTSSLLQALGLDTFANKVGIGHIFKNHTASQIAGQLVYFIILIPVIISALDTLAIAAIAEPAKAMLTVIFEYIPLLLGAMVLFGLGIVLANGIAKLVVSMLETFGFENLWSWLGLQGDDTAQNPNVVAPTQLAGHLVKIAILYFIGIEVLNILKLTNITLILQDLLVVAGHILMGLLVLAVGLFLANFTARMIRQSNVQNGQLLALLAKSAIIIISAAMGIQQMGLANDIINLAFGTLVGAVGVAAAIAFGIGGRDIAADVLKEARANLRE